MCGLLGYVGGRVQELSPRLTAGLERLSHRGPDGDGLHRTDWLWAGHKRLAILDLSPSGLQPFWGRDNRTLLLFNGEIFNYSELAAELKSVGVHPSGRSDTAVLMAALDTWGIAATLPRLNGFWAFAYIDLHTREVTLSRDRFGVKPLYFAKPAEGELVFASEPKAIAAAFPQFRQPNERAVHSFIATSSFLETGESFYAGVHVFPSASIGKFVAGDSTLRISRYWDYPTGSAEKGDPSRAYEEFTSLFDDAVRMRYRADVPVGITASGGIDSSAILLAARESHFKLSAYTSVYDVGSTNEHDRAAAVCEVSGSTLKRVVARDDEWLDTLVRIAGALDSPTSSPAVFPLHEICRQARADGVIVLLEGQGADEAFGGYVQHAAAWSLDILSASGHPFSKSARVLRALPALKTSFGATWMMLWMAKLAGPAWFRHVGSLLFPRPLVEAVTEPPLAGIQDGTAAALDREPAGRLHSLLKKEHGQTILPSLLHYGDAISMANSVELRQPFLDYRLVEWVFRQGDDGTIREGWSKWVLRKYLERHGAAFVNRWRKQGYTTPLCAWIGRHQGVIIDDILCRSGSRVAADIPPKKLRQLVGRAAGGSKTAAYHVFRLMSLELWLKTV